VAAFLATFLAGAAAAATGAGAGTGAGAATEAAGDSFFVTFFTATDLIAELIVLLPVEEFIIFKRTDCYNRICRSSNFCQIIKFKLVWSRQNSLFLLKVPEDPVKSIQNASKI
jgi:hypothetical protein